MKASIVDLRYKTKAILQARVKGHPFFGMYRDDRESVRDQMDRLRKPRHDV